MGKSECPYYKSFPVEYGGEGSDEECHAPYGLGIVVIDQHGSSGPRDCDYEGLDHCACPVYQEVKRHVEKDIVL